MILWVTGATPHRVAIYRSTEITPDHLLVALMGQEGTVVPGVLQALGLAPLMIRNRADEAVAKLPKAK